MKKRFYRKPFARRRALARPSNSGWFSVQIHIAQSPLRQVGARSSRAGRPAHRPIAVDAEGGGDRRTGPGFLARAITGEPPIVRQCDPPL